MAIVVQQPAGQRPSVVLGERDDQLRAEHRGDSQRWVAVAPRPGQEVTQRLTPGRAGKQVVVKIRLAAAG